MVDERAAIPHLDARSPKKVLLRLRVRYIGYNNIVLMDTGDTREKWFVKDEAKEPNVGNESGG